MKLVKTLKKAAAAITPAVTLPLTVLAQGSTKSVDTILGQVRTTLNIIIVILFILVTLVFIWGVVQYIMAGGEEEKLKTGRRHMIWGIIGLAVVGAAWGITAIIWNYLGVQGGTGVTPIQIP